MALTHLAIIMDGNRRWARRHTLRALAGHDEGTEPEDHCQGGC